MPITGARSYFTYDPAREVLEFAELSVQSGWGSGVMQGQASLAGIRNGQLTGLTGQLRFTDLELNPRRLFEAPVKFPGVDADFDLRLKPFRLRLGEMLVRDGGSLIHFDGEIGAGPEGWDYDLNGRVDQVGVARVKELWPEALASKPREWVRDNLHEGWCAMWASTCAGEAAASPSSAWTWPLKRPRCCFRSSCRQCGTQQASSAFTATALSSPRPRGGHCGPGR